MTRDFEVLPRRDDDLHDKAMSLREFFGISKRFQYDLPSLIEEKLVGKNLKTIGVLKLVLLDVYKPKASVTFKHGECILTVENEVWEFAKQGDSKSIFKLAHELGHLMLHNKHEQQFSDPKQSYVNFIKPDRSAETQANKFAAYFMAPRQYMRFCDTYQDLNQSFNFPLAFASFRFEIHGRDQDRRPKIRCSNCSAEYSPYNSGDVGRPFCCQ